MAFALNPSNTPLGSDGLYTPFTLGVGSSGYSIDVFPATVAASTWAIDPQVCTSSGATNCGFARGSPYSISTSSSSSFRSIGSFSLGIEGQYGWGTKKDSNGNPIETGAFGTDSIFLATSKGGVTVQGAPVGTVNTNSTPIGLFPLTAAPVTFPVSDSNTTTIKSTLQLLRDAGSIPSMSWSYTAGIANSKRPSLILGGFDANSFNQTSITFPFGADANYANVDLQSISLNSNGKTSTLSSDSIRVNIDSTIGPLWLPSDICSAFESAFQLTYKGTQQLYTMNSSAISNNNKNNPSVSFVIGSQSAGGDTVTITLPWTAFNQTFLDDNNLSSGQIPFFPLKQATTAQQYALGRTFLQSAVLTVDHERKNFTIAQVNDLEASGYMQKLQNIVSVNATSGGNGGNTTATPVPSPGDGGGGSNVGAIAGGVVGGVLAIAAIILGLWLWRRRKNRKQGPPADEAGPMMVPPYRDEKNAAAATSPPPAEMLTPERVQNEGYFAATAAGQQHSRHVKGGLSDASSELSAEGARGRARSPAPAYGAIDENSTYVGPSLAARTSQSLPAELPAVGQAHEMDSRHVSMSSAPFLPIQQPIHSPESSNVQSPVSELDDPIGPPSDNMGWNSPVGQDTPLSAQSPPMPAAARRPAPGSSGRGMAATSGPMGDGLGILNAENLQRNASTKSSKESGSTLVEGLPGSSTSAALQSQPRTGH